MSTPAHERGDDPDCDLHAERGEQHDRAPSSFGTQSLRHSALHTSSFRSRLRASHTHKNCQRSKKSIVCYPMKIPDFDETAFLAQHLLVADPNLQRVREDALLDVSRVILERRLGLTPGEYIGSRPEDKLLYLKMQIEDWSVETSGVVLHD